MSFNLASKITEELRAIADKYLVQKIILFGSRAREDNNKFSDIDIAIYPLPGFTDEGRLCSDIEDIETLLKIDMVFINKNTDEKFINNIEKDGVVIYERL